MSLSPNTPVRQDLTGAFFDRLAIIKPVIVDIDRDGLVETFQVDQLKLRPQHAGSARYFCVNDLGPVKRTPGGSKTRGSDADLVLGRAVYADLDVRPGSFSSIEEAITTAAAVGEALELTPTIVVSGGGVHVYVPVEPAPLDEYRTALRAFGALAQLVAEDRKLDSVFDTARILRLPGSLNYKSDPPTRCFVHQLGDTTTVAHIIETAKKLTGKAFEPSPAVGGSYVAPEDWPAGTTTKYWNSVPRHWEGDRIPEGRRHSDTLAKAVRVVAARRLGKISDEDTEAALVALGDRLAANRDPRPGELDSIVTWAFDRVCRMSEAELATEQTGNFNQPQLDRSSLVTADASDRSELDAYAVVCELVNDWVGVTSPHGRPNWFKWSKTNWREYGTTAGSDAISHFVSEACSADPRLARYRTYRSQLPLVRRFREDARRRIPIDSMDACEWAINTPSGVLDLRTLEVTEHDRDRHFSRITGGSFRPHVARTEIIDQLLGALPNDAVGWLLWRIGEAMLARVPADRALMLWYGDGLTGKTTLATAVRQMFGSFGALSASELLIDSGRSGGPDPAAAALAGKRLAVVEEIISASHDLVPRLSTQRLKTLSGDTVAMRGLYESMRDAPWAVTLIAVSNHLPRILELDAGTWRRIHVVPFDKKQTSSIDFERMVCTTDALDDLFTRCVQAFVGRACPERPLSVEEASSVWRLDSDPLADWVEKNLRADPDGSILLADLVRCLSLQLNWSDKAIRSAIRASPAISDLGATVGRRSNKGLMVDGVTLTSPRASL